MIGLLGKKLGQTSVYDAKGNLIPVTVVLAGPNRVVQCKTVEKDGYQAVQLGFDDQKEHRLTKAVMGHLRKHSAVAVKRLREFRDFTLPVKPGDVIGPATSVTDDIATYANTSGTLLGHSVCTASAALGDGGAKLLAKSELFISRSMGQVSAMSRDA